MIPIPKKILFIALIPFLLNLTVVCAQDSLFRSIAQANMTLLTKNPNSFSGLGWEKIITKANAASEVLIGEDHFTNEIPFFVSQLASTIKFDNFIAEIDPFTAKIFQDKIKNLPPQPLKNYVANYGNTFSFYSFAPEFNLLKQFVNGNTQLWGTDQILLVADRLICNELTRTTKNPRAKALYQLISDQSKIHFDQFLKDQSKPFYLLTNDFDKNITELSSLKLTAQEQKIIAAMKLSAKIYKTGDHHLRIQLMKNQLMEQYNALKGKKNLYKFGANHMSKGESILTIYDIGNLVSNLADARYQESFHLMIIGKSGTQASPFKGFSSEKIDVNTGNLKSLKPFFDLVKGNDWQVFDLAALKRAIEVGKIKVNDVVLSRIIKGFDMLVVIPEVSASQFVN